MGKEKDASWNGFWPFMFQAGIYKRNLGRVTRQVTFAALALGILIGALRLSQTFGTTQLSKFILPGAVVVIGWWLCFRLVNMPRFADFLIAVEAEMSKVTWPTRKELFRGSVVVIVTLVSLAVVLMCYDYFWGWLLHGLLGGSS
jgi:preprotein translocase subunit SecE